MIWQRDDETRREQRALQVFDDLASAGTQKGLLDPHCLQWRDRPGDLVKRLSSEDREALSHLTSDMTRDRVSRTWVEYS